MKFIVEVKNDILGNSSHVMSLAEIKKFNKCAELCANGVIADGKPHSMGMWTVSPAEPAEGGKDETH